VVGVTGTTWLIALIGGRAKQVEADERATRFAQEIYEPGGRLVEVHENYLIDLGHRKVD
jgi:hypothetical protein